MSTAEPEDRGQPWLWPVVLLLLFLGTVTMNLLWIAGDMGLGEGAAPTEAAPLPAEVAPARSGPEDGDAAAAPEAAPSPPDEPEPVTEDLSDQPFGFVEVEFIPESLPAGVVPGEVRILGRPYVRIERLGPRRFKITRRQGNLVGRPQLCAVDELGSRGCGYVVLDGSTSTIRIGRNRDVALTLLCDDCPEAVRCAGSHLGPACEGTPPDLSCRCLWEEVTVTGHTTQAVFDWAVDHERLGVIPEGVSEWTIDRRGERGSITAEWGGPELGGTDCVAWLEDLASRGRISELEWCHRSAVARFEDLRPGSFVLVMGIGTGDLGERDRELMGRVEVHLESGQDLDLGVIRPGQGAHLYAGSYEAPEEGSPEDEAPDTGGPESEEEEAAAAGAAEAG